MNHGSRSQTARVTFLDCPHSNRTESLCHAEAGQLFRTCPRILTCQVTVAAVAGTLQVRLALRTAEAEFEVTTTIDAPQFGADPAVRRAFALARTRLAEAASARTNPPAPHSDHP
ncbi:MAG: hypothetical protein KDC87_04175 [Planctomycetes bacterium]|nr:hypothetical protein [Planctomycetota bacterium]MCB9870084.1 hypothetical protein [Planctomycetota bacterium]MCB9889519.1 hypothetical protein [Planctomycetota bacterium]